MTTATAAESSTLMAECINPIIRSTNEVFETMLGCQPQRTGLTLKDSLEPCYDVSAIIGITGRVVGTIVVTLAEQTALEVPRRMIGMEVDRIDADVCDAIGELTNMIAGAAKAQLARLELSISIPNVVSGHGHVVHYPSNVSPMSLTFDSELGGFAVEFGFTSAH